MTNPSPHLPPEATREIDRRSTASGFITGAWYGNGTLLLFNLHNIVAGRVWGDHPGFWYRQSADRSWCEITPRFDLHRFTLNLDAKDADVHWSLTLDSREPTAPRQLRLSFSEDPYPVELDTCFSRFLCDIPTWARRQLSTFPKKHHWPLLCYLAQTGRDGGDLLTSTPALALLVALRCPAGHTPAALVPQKQRDVAASFGLPATNSTVRILRRIAASILSLDVIDRLRPLLHDAKAAKKLRHLEEITVLTCDLMEEREVFELASPRLLAEITESGDVEKSATVRRTLRRLKWARSLGYDGPAAVSDFRHAQHLSDYVARLLRTVNHRPADHQLPPAPVASTAAVRALTTVGQLCREGAHMHHCVASYVDQVVAGTEAIYHVDIGSEALTLRLSRCGCRWWIAEVAGPYNDRPSDDAVRSVEEWFSENAEMPDTAHRCPDCLDLPQNQRCVPTLPREEHPW